MERNYVTNVWKDAGRVLFVDDDGRNEGGLGAFGASGKKSGTFLQKFTPLRERGLVEVGKAKSSGVTTVFF